MVTRINFSMAYISHPIMISVKNTWESMRLYSVISRILLANLGRRCLCPSKGWFQTFTRGVTNILGILLLSLIQKRRNFSNLFVLLKALWDSGSTVCNNSIFLARKSGRRIIVLIDEYEVPINYAYEFGFFSEANEFFGRSALPALLKSNDHLGYALLVGVIPVTKAGWYSCLNNIETHALHQPDSIFAGMMMFTETEVLELRRLSESELTPEELKAHYNSYLAASHINVYNPVSIMSAFQQRRIANFWVSTGEFPPLHRNFMGDASALDIIERLLSGHDISLELEDSVTFDISTLNLKETLTLLYYAGYLTMTSTGRFKIPNQEVMTDWVRWITGGAQQSYTHS